MQLPVTRPCFKFFSDDHPRPIVEISCFCLTDPLTLRILNAHQHSCSSCCYRKWPQVSSITQPHAFPTSVISVWFYIGIEVISDFMCVSGVQELDRFMDEHLSILFQVLVPN